MQNSNSTELPKPSTFTYTYDESKAKSYFTGNSLYFTFINLVVILGSIFSLSIAFPWLICWRQKWIARHTYINGCVEKFNGNGAQLIGNFIKWILLTIITIGIYSLWLSIKLQKWLAKHTIIDGAQGESDFDGGVLGNWGSNWLCRFVTIITLGLAYPWAICYKYKWRLKHTTVSGYRLKFNGKAIQLFGNWIKWVLLSLITIGIYAFYVACKKQQWLTKHTDSTELKQSEEIKTLFSPVLPDKLTDYKSHLCYEGIKENIKHSTYMIDNSVPLASVINKFQTLIFVAFYMFFIMTLALVILYAVLIVPQGANQGGPQEIILPAIMALLAIICAVLLLLTLYSVAPTQKTSLKSLKRKINLLSIFSILCTLSIALGSPTFILGIIGIKLKYNLDLAYLFYKNLYEINGINDHNQPIGEDITQITLAYNYKKHTKCSQK